jgi:hypothetical protein
MINIQKVGDDWKKGKKEENREKCGKIVKT